MNRKTKIKIIRHIWYTLYVAVEFSSLALLAGNRSGIGVMLVVLIWITMTIINCYVDLIKENEEDNDNA